MIKITANRIGNMQATRIETSISGSLTDIMVELSSVTTSVINEITEPLPKELKIKIAQEFVSNVYLTIIGGKNNE